MYHLLLFFTWFFVCIFAVNREYTFTRCEKYSSRLDISRSFVCIFDVV